MNRPDSIETFIRDNRHAFDTAAAEAYAWQSIEKSLARLRFADEIESEVLFNRALMDTEAPSENVWLNIEQCLEKQNTHTPDQIETFIRKHRDALDTEVPDLKVWTNIAAEVPAKTKIVRMTWQRSLLRAAASIALLVTGLGLGIWYARSSETPAMSMGDVSTEYAELEQYFQRDISAKQQKLATFTGSQPAEVHQDLEQLDIVMSELQQELANVPTGNREQVVRAMIENYKAKAAILERVLERLEPTKTETKNNDSEIKNI